MRNFRSNPAQRRDHYQELTDKIIAARSRHSAMAATVGQDRLRRRHDRSTQPPAIATEASTSSSSECRRSLSHPTTAMVQLPSGRRARLAGPQGREGDAGLFYKPIEIEDKTTMANWRRGASRSCAHSRSFTLPRSTEFQSLRLRWRRRLWPSGSRTSRSSFKRAASLSGSAGTGRSTPATFDFVQIPPDEAFHSPELRAATLFHELSHATGHVSRLNRDLSGSFGSISYAKEELRAELASYAIGSMIGLPCDVPNHASYIQSWIEVLKQDRREIFHAAAEAQRIADYILAFHPDYAEKPADPSGDDDDASTIVAPLAA